MIILDKYKITIERLDFCLYKKAPKEIVIRENTGDKLKIIKTGEYKTEWCHVCFCANPWEALRRIISLEASSDFEEVKDIKELLQKLSAIELKIHGWYQEVNPQAKDLYRTLNTEVLC